MGGAAGLLNLFILIALACLFIYGIRWLLAYLEVGPPFNKVIFVIAIIAAIIVIVRFGIGIGGQPIAVF